MIKTKFIAIIQRFTNIAGNGLLVLVASNTVTEEQMGIFFSLIAIYQFHTVVEMGFGYAIIHFLSKESDLRTKDNIIRFARKRFRLVALIYLALSVILVNIIFNTTFETISTHSIENALLFVFGATIRVYSLVNDFTSEGLGEVDKAYLSRIAYQVTFVSLAILMLVSGFELYALSLSIMIASVFILAVQIFFYKRRIQKCDCQKFDLIRDFNTFHQKIALSFMSGFFVYQLVNPIILMRYGAEDAANVGYIIFIISACNNVVSALIYPLQHYVTVNYKNMRKGLYKFTYSTFSPSFFLAILLFFLLNIWLLKYPNLIETIIVIKVPSAFIMILWSSSIVINQIISVCALSVRASGDDPFVFSSILSALVSIIVMFLTFDMSAFTHAMLITFLPVVLIGLPSSIFYYRHLIEES